jgi:hypothetical protein
LNGKTPHAPDAGDQIDWAHLMTEKQVRAELDINAAQFSAFLRRGLLQKVRQPGGTEARFSPIDVEKVRIHLEDNQATELANSHEVNSELNNVLGKACKLLDQAHSHIEKITGLLTGPMGEGIKFMQQIVTAQNDRIATMQNQIDAAILTREQWLSMSHDRELKSQREAAKQVHINTAIEGAMQAVGPVLQPLSLYLAQKLGIPTGHPGLELLADLDPQKVLMIANAGMLSPYQIERCRVLWPDLQWPAPANDNAAAASSPPKPANDTEPAPANDTAAPSSPPAEEPRSGDTQPSPPPPASPVPDTEPEAPIPRRRRRRKTQGEAS